MNATPGSGHALNSGTDLFKIGDIGTEPERGALRVLYFEFGDVQFRLTSAQKTDPDTGLCKTYGESFADTTSGAGDQGRGILGGTQTGILYRI